MFNISINDSSIEDDLLTQLMSTTISTNSSLLTDRYKWAELFLEFAPAYVMLDRYVTLIWILVGFFGNLLSFFVWITPQIRRDNSSAIYLAALSLTDFFLLVCMILLDLQMAWGISVLDRYIFCECYYVIFFALQYTSPILVLAFTVERWIAICYPFRREQLCTPRRAIFVVLSLAGFTLGVCLVQGYFWRFTESDGCASRPDMEDELGWQLYTWCTEILMSAALPGLILLFNLLVIREFKRITSRGPPPTSGENGARLSVPTVRLRVSNGGSNSMSSTGGVKFVQNHREMSSNLRSTTMMLLSVSFFLICTTMPAGLVYALQGVTPNGKLNMSDAQIHADPTWNKFFRMMVIKKSVDELSLSHFACNFLIYFATGRIFRTQACRLLCCGRRRTSSEERGGRRFTKSPPSFYNLRSESRLHSLANFQTTPAGEDSTHDHVHTASTPLCDNFVSPVDKETLPVNGKVENTNNNFEQSDCLIAPKVETSCKTDIDSQS